MTDAADPPRLWHFRVSHFNEKVRWALDHKRWPHTRTALVPGWHLPVARWVSGQSLLPVLRIDGRVLAGSNHILRELEHLRPESPLFPSDPAALERALAIQAYFDDEVAPDLRRLFWATYVDDAAACARMATDGFSTATRRAWQALFPLMRPLFRRNMQMVPAELAATRRRMTAHFDRLATEIGPHGYLVGDRFGVADLAAAAVMTAIIRPPEFPYPLPEPWPPALVELRESVAGHAAFRWVLDIYARHRGTSSEVVARQGAPAAGLVALHP
jgi:glutathione S-transferase